MIRLEGNAENLISLQTDGYIVYKRWIQLIVIIKSTLMENEIYRSSRYDTNITAACYANVNISLNASAIRFGIQVVI